MTDQFLWFQVQSNSYRRNSNTPYKSLIVTAGEFQKSCNLDLRTFWKNDMQTNSVLTLEKMPQNRIDCFILLLEHLALIEHQFLSVIRDSRKSERGVGRVRKSIHQSWWAKRLGLGSLCWGFMKFWKRFCRKRPAIYKSAKWHFHQDNAPVDNFIRVTDYLTKMGIKTVHHPPSSPDLAPCDFFLFPKPRGCCYVTIEEMKEAVTKVINTLTQDDFHGAFQKLLEWYYRCIAAGGDCFEVD